MIPELAFNKNSKHDISYYQITNISDDCRSFTFMGETISIYNKEAAAIIRDRIQKDYYDNLDYGITPDELDVFDHECILHGEMLLKYPQETPKQIIPTRPYPLRKLSWIELDRLARGEEDMTLLEINELMHDVYGIDLNTVQKDKRILERHKELEALKQTEALEQTEKLEQDTQEESEVITGEKVEILVKYDESLIEGIRPHSESYRKAIISQTGRLEDDRNYISLSSMCKQVFDRPLENEEIKNLKKYIIKLGEIFQISPYHQRVYKGILGIIMSLGVSYGLIQSEYHTIQSIIELSDNSLPSDDNS